MSESSKREKKRLGSVTYAIREITAICIWLFIVIKLAVFDFDLYLVDRFAPSLMWVLDCKFFILMIGIALLWLVLGKHRFRQIVAYVLIYPLVLLLWKLPKLILSRWPIVLALAPALYDIVTTFRLTFIMYSFAMIAGLFIAISSKPAVLIPSMSILFVFLVLHLWRSILMVYRANIFAGLSRLTRKLREHLESWESVADATEGDTDEPDPAKQEKAKENEISAYYFLNCIFNLIAEKVRDVAVRRVDLYLIASWLYTVAITIVVFAFENWALARISPDAYHPQPEGFWPFLGMSLSILTTSNVSSITAVAVHAKLLSHFEVVITLVLLVIFVFTILTVAREIYRSDINLFVDELQQTASVIENKIRKIFQLTLPEVEIILLNSDPNTVNWLRRVRGLPELPPPKAKEGDNASEKNGS